MSADERKAGAIAAARTLSFGTGSEAEPGDVRAITNSAQCAVATFVHLDVYPIPALALDHIAGAAQFFHELSEALRAKAGAVGPVETLARVCESLGAEKLPGLLRVEPTPVDIRQMLAYIRGELDAIERDFAAALDE